MGINKEVALAHCTLAPLAVKRDIAMLGIIHRTVLGKGPLEFKQFFALDASGGPARGGRRHSKHLVDPCSLRSPEYVVRSALGAVRVYNLLPESVVSATRVNSFQ